VKNKGFFSLSVQIIEQDYTLTSGIIYGSAFIPNKAQSASSISVNSERGKCSTGHFFVIQCKLIHNYCYTHCHLNPIARHFCLATDSREWWDTSSQWWTVYQSGVESAFDMLYHLNPDYGVNHQHQGMRQASMYAWCMPVSRIEPCGRHSSSPLSLLFETCSTLGHLPQISRYSMTTVMTVLNSMFW